MGNGYRAPQDDASDLGKPGEEIRMTNAKWRKKSEA
jgi:hypothetical protein